LSGLSESSGQRINHLDHLNTPRLVADSTGTTVWKWDQQEPFGDSPPDENPSGLGPFEFNKRYDGQYYDKETGLTQNWFRDYDKSLGRFPQSDPIGLRGGLNTYAYVDENPLSFSDPEGKILQGVLIGAGIEVALQAVKNFREGCDVLEVANYDWGNVFIAAGVGIFAPGWLSVAKRASSSSRAIEALYSQLGRARTVARTQKIEARIQQHTASITDAITVQLGYQALNQTAQALNGEQRMCKCRAQ